MSPDSNDRVFARAPDASPRCDSNFRELLIPYTLGYFSEKEEVAVSSHLLVCDPCSADLSAVDRVREVIADFIDNSKQADGLIRVLRPQARRKRALVAGLLFVAGGLVGFLIAVLAGSS